MLTSWPALRGPGLLVAVILTGCATARVPGQDEITQRSHRYHEVLEAGFAVTPVGLADPGEDAVSVSSHLTEQLYTALFVTSGQTQLVAPDDALDLIRGHGEAGLDAFRDFRGDRILGQPLDRDTCVRMSRILQHRYVLISWVEEEEQGGMEEMDRDYTEADFANDVRRAAFRVVLGNLHGMVVDLWEAEVMWAGAARYRTSRLFSEGIQARQELDRARDEGVLDLVNLLWQL